MILPCEGSHFYRTAAKSFCADGADGLQGGLDSTVPAGISAKDLDLPFPEELVSHEASAATFLGSGRERTLAASDELN